MGWTLTREEVLDRFEREAKPEEAAEPWGSSLRVRLLQNLVSARPWWSAASPQASSALRMQTRRTKPLRGGPTAPSPMGI